MITWNQLATVVLSIVVTAVGATYTVIDRIGNVEKGMSELETRMIERFHQVETHVALLAQVLKVDISDLAQSSGGGGGERATPSILRPFGPEGPVYFRQEPEFTPEDLS